MSEPLTEVFKVLSDENRFKIIKIIAKGEKYASQILEDLGISQPTLSHHMRVLTKAGLVKSKKQATQVYYELDKEKVGCLCDFVREISCGHRMCGSHKEEC